MKSTIELLSPADIDAAQNLVELAGWNQLPPDWLRLLEREPEGCFKATGAGQLLGTVTTICYGAAMAWIGMMLVHPAARRQGIGKQLMLAAISYLKARGIQAIGLDATPLGRPLYEQLGFAVSSQWQRWQRESAQPTLTDSTEAQPQLYTTYRQLDKLAFGVDRWSWIETLSQGSLGASAEQGYGLLRPGRIAAYLGPLVATDSGQAEQLAQQLLAQSSGVCLWDVPPSNPQAEALAKTLGFQPVRVLYRMWLDQPGPTGKATYTFAISDPATA